MNRLDWAYIAKKHKDMKTLPMIFKILREIGVIYYYACTLRLDSEVLKFFHASYW